MSIGSALEKNRVHWGPEREGWGEGREKHGVSLASHGTGDSQGGEGLSKVRHEDQKVEAGGGEST